MRFLFFIILTLLNSEVCFGKRLILSPAEKVFLPLPLNKKVKIGDKSLVEIQPEQGQLSLLAKKEGQTLLISGRSHYEIFIFNVEKKHQALQLDKLLKKFWGLNWSLSSEHVFQITGQLNRIYDWAELAKASEQHNILYEFRALPVEGLKPPIQHYFKELFKAKGLPEIAME